MRARWSVGVGPGWGGGGGRGSSSSPAQGMWVRWLPHSWLGSHLLALTPPLLLDRSAANSLLRPEMLSQMRTRRFGTREASFGLWWRGMVLLPLSVGYGDRASPAESSARDTTGQVIML